MISEIYQGACAPHSANYPRRQVHRYRRYEGPDQADGRHSLQRTRIQRRPPSGRRRHLVRSREDVRYHGARRVRHHRTPSCGGPRLGRGIASSGTSRYANYFRVLTVDLQPDDEPFHGNVTEDGSEPPAQLNASPVALEQPQQSLPAPTNVPQVLEPRPSQPLVFPNSNPVEVTPSPSVPRPRKTRQPQSIIPTTRVLRSMVPSSPAPEPSPPTFARSFFVDTVTTIPDELVHIITVQEGKRDSRKQGGRRRHHGRDPIFCR